MTIADAIPLRRQAREEPRRLLGQRISASAYVMSAAVVPFEEEEVDSSATELATPKTPEDIVQRAEMLGVPWQRVLREEIEAELKLRRYLSELDRAFPLLRAAEILSFSVLRSWRVRDRIESLACEARTSTPRGALRPLRLVFRRLTGKGERDSDDASRRLWFAYQRVLLLQRVRRVAGRSRGDMPDRLAYICSTARCAYDDAAWAVSQEDSPRRGHRLDAAVAKVREEGFPIPRAETEARALTELRRMLHRRPRRIRFVRPLSAPRRVRLPLDAF
jgi:hypothetical protein